jgi:hypothetical protein
VYSHCIFCKTELGSNEAIAKFPIGRRLAFDAERGRLWVVCRRCERWNLTPLEERWEAIEECERFFRDTRTRVATENIGLARIPEGLDLVRIGRPQLPEFAAWRYGEQLVRRRKRYVVAGTLGVGVALVAAGAPLLAGAGLPFAANLPQVANWIRDARTVTRVQSAAGISHKVSRRNARNSIMRTASARWYLEVPHRKGAVHLEGEAALRVAGLILPHINSSGAKRTQVQAAVREIQSHLNTEHLFLSVAKAQALKRTLGGDLVSIIGAPVEIRLALEMAAHESQERRALEGELAELEAMWQEAEEIASISDNLLVPKRITELFTSKKREQRG